MAGLNVDFSKRVVINSEQMPWIDSPMPGVRRRPLARATDENGHITSIVQYQPGSYFSSHSHPLGEEIFVLEGTFSDENGDYEKGTYLRNPPGSSHQPFSQQGCTILVKLNQFESDDKQQVTINTNTSSWQPGIGCLQVMPLHDFAGQHTALVKWPAGKVFQPHSHFGGEEILVLSGTFKDEHGIYPKHSWIRSPHLSEHHPFVEEETIILVKVGHLPID
ncbi:cupin domain-containing protein [Psychromonas ossibalaenae]|uniref:cupin domain-containing protein n=1 Tax=Psychromonas ossibalaenae TaxID=444922 RepID=UPI000363DADC|nr:cupin domain-containing protein [Psychromonas ossibalaenae]